MRRLTSSIVICSALVTGLIALTGVSASAATCTPTGYVRDAINLTAAQIGGDVTGTLDATGCDVGVYYDAVYTGSVTGADIYGARYFGVVVNGGSVNVTESSIHGIGNVPFDGAQHGVAVYYAYGSTSTGTVSGNQVYDYQKGGIVANGATVDVTITDNTVTGLGRVDFIAQNGIQLGYGATGTITGNTVTGNLYTQGAAKGYVSAGILLLQANLTQSAGEIASSNHSYQNQANIFYIK